MKPRLLDLFCGAGGAARGYQRAGFHVTGVDLVAQPRYAGDEFVQDDAIRFLQGLRGDEFDLVHASPPCQGYSPHVSSVDSAYAGTKGRSEPRLIAATRTAIREALPVPYVIENVVGARHELRASVLLCGSMVGLPIPRHRLFEASVPLEQPWHPPCNGMAKRYAEERGWDPRDMTVTGKGRRKGTLARWSEVMGIDWPMTQHEMREAIPPAFTLVLGRHLVRRFSEPVAA